MTKTPVKLAKKWYKTVGGFAHIRYHLSIHFVIDNAGKMAKFNFQKSHTNNLRIISKRHAYFQTMTKTPVKFQKNRYKAVGEVAPTRYHLSIHFVIRNAGKMAEFNLLANKVSNNNLRIISKPHANFQTMTKTPVKCLNNRYKTVGGVAPTRYLLSIHIVIDNALK